MSLKGEIVVGIDVGGHRKGFHAVALRGTHIEGIHESALASSIVEWCVENQAVVVGVDAPCQWSTTGRARLAERELMQEGIRCFSTPTRAKAIAHPTNNFGWMLAGEELFSQLCKRYLLFSGKQNVTGNICFETFPQAVACALAGKAISAQRKSSVRRKLLKDQRIDAALLRNIDFVDAALCAVAANCLLTGQVHEYGDVHEGFIVAPKRYA